MPWKEISPMDEKVLFISDYIREPLPFAQLCRRYNISRKTGYKWVARYQQLGINGLEEQSRKPHSHPATIAYSIRKSIIELRTNSIITLGAKKILVHLEKMYPGQPMPSISSIYNILNAHDLVHKRCHRRRVGRYPRPLSASTEPNDLWTIDFKGQFKLSNGQWCYPLTLMDDYSRYLIGCQGQYSVKTTSTYASLKQLFKEFGLPKRIRSDNGVPFASKASAGLSKLSIWWIKLGILPERIEPGKPQQNGKHERMHRTLKQATTNPVSSCLSGQQRRFNEFKQAYNEHRPHEAIGQKMPCELYAPSSIVYPKRLPTVEYPAYFDVRQVRYNGVVYWNNGQVYITHLLKKEWVGLEEVDDGLFNVYFSFYRLGSFNVRDVKKGACNYWTLKLLPMYLE